MSTTLTLEIPDQIYLPLQRSAEKQGKNLNQIILEWLVNTVKDEQDEPLSWLGCMRNSGKIIGDILSPAEDSNNWNVLSE